MESPYKESYIAEERKLRYKAEAALDRVVETVVSKLSKLAPDNADRVYCYCGNIGGYKTIIRAFYTSGENAVDFIEEIGEADFQSVQGYILEKLQKALAIYIDYGKFIPSELYLDFEPRSKDVHGLVDSEIRLSPEAAELRYKAWLKEHNPVEPDTSGGIVSRIFSRFFKYAESAEMNTESYAVELDMHALSLARKYVARKGPMPYVLFEPETPWDVLRKAFWEAYHNIKEPKRYIEEYMEDDFYNWGYKPFRGNARYTRCEWIDVYDVGDSWHMVSFGLSCPSLGSSVSHYYSEFTLRIRKNEERGRKDIEYINALNLLLLLERDACSNNRIVDEYSCLSLGHKKGMDCRGYSDKTAFIIVPDAKLKPTQGPQGLISFRQAVPITWAEKKALDEGVIDVKTLYEKIGTDLIDYDRPSVI